jgi:hypothetical protein
LPAKLGADGSLRISLPVAETPASSPFPLTTCELRIGFRGLLAEARVEVKLNGRMMAGGVRFSTNEIVKATPRQRDAAEFYVHAAVPDPAQVVSGPNEIAVAVTGAAAGVEVTDVELRYAYQNDYDKLWQREPVRLNEGRE